MVSRSYTLKSTVTQWMISLIQLVINFWKCILIFVWFLTICFLTLFLVLNLFCDLHLWLPCSSSYHREFGVEQNILIWKMWWLPTQLFIISMMFFFSFSTLWFQFFFSWNFLCFFCFCERFGHNYFQVFQFSVSFAKNCDHPKLCGIMWEYQRKTPNH